MLCLELTTNKMFDRIAPLKLKNDFAFNKKKV